MLVFTLFLCLVSEKHRRNFFLPQSKENLCCFIWLLWTMVIMHRTLCAPLLAKESSEPHPVAYLEQMVMYILHANKILN